MSVVSIVKCENYSSGSVMNAVKKSLEHIGGINKFIKPGMKVVLKPNLVMRKKPEDTATTHPEIVRAVALLASEAGADVTVAESPGGPFNETLLRLVYDKCGISAAVKGIARLNYDTSTVEIDLPSGLLLKKVTVIKPLAEADLVINLPKLKTHAQMIYTGAVKNLFGAVPGTLKADYHLRMPNYEDFANALIDIFLSISPGLSIMDAVDAMEGLGPTSGNTRHLGIIMAGENAFDLDLAALQVINARPGDIPLFKNAAKRGLCSLNADALQVEGESIRDIMVNDFDIPGIDSLKAVEFFDKGIMKRIVRGLRPKPVLIKQRCKGCADCFRNCPARTISMKGGFPEIDLSSCIRCFCCQELCPVNAMTIKRPLISRLIFNKRK